MTQLSFVVQQRWDLSCSRRVFFSNEGNNNSGADTRQRDTRKKNHINILMWEEPGGAFKVMKRKKYLRNNIV